MAPMIHPRDAACSPQRLGPGFPQLRTKRVKLQHDSSPGASTVSDDAALVPTTVPDDTTDNTDADSDQSSDVSESSEEPSDESSEEASDEDDIPADGGVQNDNGIVNLRANRGEKPVMKLGKLDADDIRPFLKDFLPKLKAANEELEVQRRAGTLKTAEMEEGGSEEGEEQYIELNLGLGVLEAEGDGTSNAAACAGDGEKDERPQDVLDKLMGREKTSAGVQVVGEETQRQAYKDDTR